MTVDCHGRAALRLSVSAPRGHPVGGLIYTVGHSTRSIDDVLALLEAQRIKLLVDVRQFPQSRRMPQFNRDALAASLARHEIGYEHFQALGGRRKPSTDSINAAWREEGFRGYADYMQTDQFTAALECLMSRAGAQRTAIMCAEALYWRCHRRLIADALLARGWTVLHIQNAEKVEPHQLPSFARIEGVRVTYPAAQAQLFQPTPATTNRPAAADPDLHMRAAQ